ncbi:PaaI family thioesterase [Reyranella sp. CPCC 100927]|uniref:PaaI family thioesterase n=1 Tax=Reyranella sp. CPCC 100927 TaxID=2599616 RepID=UPI0011B52967|nr:PaaI family thioesterase [Reyranella sp. CPCC 100927]TWT05145.1 PaaI family thioesterase [Reyranella sp. CPCC 100927]
MPDPVSIDPPPGFVALPARGGFTERNGPWFEKTEADGRVLRGLHVLPRHLNALGIVHGGLLTAFIDAALGAAAWRASGRRCVTLSLNVEFLSHGRLGDWIEAEAHCAGFDSQVAHVSGRLYGRRHSIMTGQGLFALLRPGRALQALPSDPMLTDDATSQD